MKFVIKKEDLYNGINIVEKAASTKALQPVLANIYIETIDNGTIKLIATDLDLTVTAQVDAQVEEEGKITLPSSTLKEIVSKLGNKLITFEMAPETNIVNITCQNSKFDIIGISADEFPREVYNVDTSCADCLEIEIKPLTKAVNQAGFAAASYEVSNLLSGIVCDVQNEILEIASTDGNRLARFREQIKNPEGKSQRLIIPSRALNEFIRISYYMEEDSVKIYTEKTKIIFKSEKTTLISRLLDGQYPNYNLLIPSESPKNALVNVAQFIAAIERVAIMVNDKTCIVKLEFSNNTLKLTAYTSTSGKSEEEVAINYSDDELSIAFNYKFILQALKNLDSEEVRVGLNTNLSATVIRPNNDEDFVCLVMPVQIR